MEQGNVAVETPQNQSFDASLVNQETVQEKMIPQSQVGAIVAKAKAHARSQVEQEYAQMMQQANNGSNFSANNALTEEHVRNIMQEGLKNTLQEMALNHQEQLALQNQQKIAQELAQKLKEGKSKYDDFDEVVINEEALNYVSPVADLINFVDNPVEVTYELVRNHPDKLNELIEASEKRPHLAKQMLAKFSESLKQNQQVQNVNAPPPPLSQLKPSRGLDNGSLSTSDFRKMPSHRG